MTGNALTAMSERRPLRATIAGSAAESNDAPRVALRVLLLSPCSHIAGRQVHLARTPRVNSVVAALDALVLGFDPDGTDLNPAAGSGPLII